MADRGQSSFGGQDLKKAARRVVSRLDGHAHVPQGPQVPQGPAHHGDEARLWLQLMSCSALIETEIRQRLRDRFDFSPARFDLLAQLARSKAGLALSDVSKLMMVSQSNITALTNHLIRTGHIRRTPSATDRRVQIISLTAAGRAAFKKMEAQRTKWVGEMFANIPANRRAVLAQDLARLKQWVASSITCDGPRSR
jgi:DNA-binding MarR family transcriptional regulator